MLMSLSVNSGRSLFYIVDTNTWNFADYNVENCDRLEICSLAHCICPIAESIMTHLVFTSQLLAYLQQTRLLFTLARGSQKIYIYSHHHVPRPRFPIRCGNFCDLVINKGYIACLSICMRKTAWFLLLVWNLTSLSCSSTPVSYMMREFQRFANM